MAKIKYLKDKENNVILPRTTVEAVDGAVTYGDGEADTTIGILASDVNYSGTDLNSALGGIKFGVDADGKWGYIPRGADSVVPFSHTEFVSSNYVKGTNTLNFDIPSKGKFLLFVVTSNNAWIDGDNTVSTISIPYGTYTLLNTVNSYQSASDKALGVRALIYELNCTDSCSAVITFTNNYTMNSRIYALFKI